jgi:predicted dehydrogenase
MASRQPIEVVLIGAGNRGLNVYATHLHATGEAQIVAVADPSEERRELAGRLLGIPGERRFASWEELIGLGRLGEGALVCTREQDHEGPTVAALELGYDVLVEKPLAPTLEGCLRIVAAAESAPGRLQVAHVLRYAPFFRALHDALEEGVIGEIVNVEQRENLGYYHMAHSYVRGSWARSSEVGPMILTKCCHDFDILRWNLGRECVRLSSFGTQHEFAPGRVDESIPERCTDGCPIEAQCLYSAIGTYLEFRAFPALRAELLGGGKRPEEVEAPRIWPFPTLSADGSYSARRKAIETGPYGRCVFRCGNDTPENQIVAMEFEGGVTATLTMQGHSFEEHRSLRYDGTLGTLRGRFGAGTELLLHEHGAAAPRQIAVDDALDMHGGGDERIVRSFIRVIRGEEEPQTPASDALTGHLLAFAADQARRSGAVVDPRALALEHTLAAS